MTLAPASRVRATPLAYVMPLGRASHGSGSRRRAGSTRRTDTMTSLRKTAFVAGLLYLITYLAIPTVVLYGPALDDPNFIASAGNSTGVLWAAVLELIVAFAIVGTGVALFPVLKRQNEGVALGFVTSRLFEAGIIIVGIISVLSIVTLQPGGRCGRRSRCGLAGHHRTVARRDPRLDVPDRADPPPRHQRPPARIAHVPVRPRAARHPAAGPHRRPADDLVRARAGRRHQRASTPPGRRSRSCRSSCGS